MAAVKASQRGFHSSQVHFDVQYLFKISLHVYSICTLSLRVCWVLGLKTGIKKCNFQSILKNMPPPSIKNDGSQVLQISLLLPTLPLTYQSCPHSFYNIGVIFASCDSLKIVNNSYQAEEMYHYMHTNNVPRQQRNVVLLSVDASCLFTSLKPNSPPLFF